MKTISLDKVIESLKPVFLLIATLLMLGMLIFGYSVEDSASEDAAGTEACKHMQAVQNLDGSQLKGKWYEWSRFGTSFLFPDHRCQVSFWYLGIDGQTITVLSDFLTNDPDEQGPPEQKRGAWNITFETPSPDGKLVASIDTNSLDHQIIPMYVLDTDYSSYLLIHMCKKIANSFYNAGLILTRHKTNSIENIITMEENINKTLKANGIEPSKFNAAIQSKCVKVEFPESYDVPRSGGSLEAWVGRQVLERSS